MTDLTSYAPVRVFLAGLWRLLFSVPLFLVAYVVLRATILNPPKAAPAPVHLTFPFRLPLARGCRRRRVGLFLKLPQERPHAQRRDQFAKKQSSDNRRINAFLARRLRPAANAARCGGGLRPRI